MSGETSIGNPEHWRSRAEEARMIARETKDSRTKDALLRIADEYEHLAYWADWTLRYKELKNLEGSAQTH